MILGNQHVIDSGYFRNITVRLREIIMLMTLMTAGILLYSREKSLCNCQRL